jgi:hypothetical protein
MIACRAWFVLSYSWRIGWHLPFGFVLTTQPYHRPLLFATFLFPFVTHHCTTYNSSSQVDPQAVDVFESVNPQVIQLLKLKTKKTDLPLRLQNRQSSIFTAALPVFHEAQTYLDDCNLTQICSLIIGVIHSMNIGQMKNALYCMTILAAIETKYCLGLLRNFLN